MKNKFILLMAAALLAGGCQSNPKPKASLERGWIGGEYRDATRKLVPKGQTSKVYVRQVYSETPAEQAGLQPGDLILAFNGHPVSGLKEFYRLVDAATPGSEVVVRFFRHGQPREFSLVVGRERYQEWHSLMFGLGASTRFDLWPNPDFSLLPLARYRWGSERVELRSPEVILARQAGQVGQGGNKGETGTHSEEGWDAWLLVFGLNAHKQILGQEAVKQ